MKVGRRTYRVLHPASVDALLEEEDFENEERLPYWAELWPSSVALARHLARRDLAGLRVVELGCGVGLPSVVALDHGAKVLATDHNAAALDFAAHNARANTGREPEVARLDWFAPELDGFGTFDLVFAADVLYERRNTGALAGLVPRLLAPDSEFILADPRRPPAPEFLDAMKKRGFGISTEGANVEQDGRKVRVHLYRLRPKK